jgi:polar amino acid transport system substrate-binding protein
MRSHRKLAGALLASLLLVAAACSDDGGDDGGGPTTTTVAGAAGRPGELAHDGRLTTCHGAAVEPFELDPAPGQPAGFAVDLLRAVAEDAGLEVAVGDADGPGLGELAAGECDVITAWAVPGPSDAPVAVTAPYYDSALSLLVRAEDGEAYATLARLMGQRIGALRDSAGATYATKHTPDGASVVLFDDVDALVAALHSKEVAAVVTDLPVGAWRAHRDPGLAVVERFTTSAQVGFAVDHVNGDLRAFLDAGLDRLRSDGRYDAIYASYFGDG